MRSTLGRCVITGVNTAENNQKYVVVPLLAKQNVKMNRWLPSVHSHVSHFCSFAGLKNEFPEYKCVLGIIDKDSTVSYLRLDHGLPAAAPLEIIG